MSSKARYIMIGGFLGAGKTTAILQLGKKLREAEERLENMAFKGIPAHLASLLLRLSEEQGSRDIMGLTHQDLAESVGTYRETATQVLNDLKASGLIIVKVRLLIVAVLRFSGRKGKENRAVCMKVQV